MPTSEEEEKRKENLKAYSSVHAIIFYQILFLGWIGWNQSWVKNHAHYQKICAELIFQMRACCKRSYQFGWAHVLIIIISARSKQKPKLTCPLNNENQKHIKLMLYTVYIGKLWKFHKLNENRDSAVTATLTSPRKTSKKWREGKWKFYSWRWAPASVLKTKTST